MVLGDRRKAQALTRAGAHEAGALQVRLPGIAVVDPLLLMASAIHAAVHPGPFDASFRADAQHNVIFKGPWGIVKADFTAPLKTAAAADLPWTSPALVLATMVVRSFPRCWIGTWLRGSSRSWAASASAVS